MSRMTTRRPLHVLLLLALAGLAAPAHAWGDPWESFGGGEEQPAVVPEPRGTAAALHAWRASCAPCHGATGRGNGPAARWLDPPPRDLSRGEFKWRSTPTGSLPTDADILRTIDRGARGTRMPAWEGRLPERTRRELVTVVKSLSPRFATEAPGEAIEIPEPPAATQAMVDRGRDVYQRLKCWECHGEDGQGGGPSAATLEDSRGRRIGAYDFTKGYYKAGESAEDVYRTFMTGLNGTPMPSYEQTISEGERWPLVYYVMSLGRCRDGWDWLFAPTEEQP